MAALAAFASLNRTVKTIALILFGLAGAFGLLFFLFSQLWLSYCIFERHPHDEIIERKIKGDIDVYSCAQNDSGATGDFNYAIYRVRKLCPGLIFKKCLDARYGGHYDNLEIIDDHHIRFVETEKDLPKLTTRQLFID